MPDEVDGHRLLGVLGQGGMGVVYLAEAALRAPRESNMRRRAQVMEALVEPARAWAEVASQGENSGLLDHTDRTGHHSTGRSRALQRARSAARAMPASMRSKISR